MPQGKNSRRWLATTLLARLNELCPTTVRKWRQRTATDDASHRPKTLRAKLSLEQEIPEVEMCRPLLLPLGDLLAMVHKTINDTVSPSGLNRCLRRHGVSRLADLIPQEKREKAPVKPFKDYVPGFVHIDLKYLPQIPDEDSRQNQFAAIDPATRQVYVKTLPNEPAKRDSGLLKRLSKAALFIISKVLTDNGKEFSDRFCTTGQREPTGEHAFDKVCASNDIEHRLTKPAPPNKRRDRAF